MKYVFKELRRHLLRTMVGISGYVIVTLFIIIIITVTRNNEKDTTGILKGTGTHFIVYIPSGSPCCASTTCNGSLIAEGLYSQLLSRDMLNQIRHTKGVRDAAPYLLYKMYNQQFKSDISIGGVDTNNIATRTNVCSATNIIEGKFISSEYNEVVVEESFARAHKLHMGDTLNIFGTKLDITGIINTGIKPVKADFYTTLENLKNILKDHLELNVSGFDMNIILVEVADARNQVDIMNTMKIQNQYSSISSYNCYVPATNVMSIIGMTSSTIYGIIFLFLMIFTAKTQTASIMERLREIGILKSLGWSNRRLGIQIIAVSMIQAIAGIIIGSALAVIILLLLKYFNIQLLEISMESIYWSQIFFVCIISLIGGFMASFFPTIKVFRLSAGDIMRSYL